MQKIFLGKKTLSNKWKENMYKATNGDIFLEADIEYEAEVYNMEKNGKHTGQFIRILDAGYEITLPPRKS